MSVNDAIEEDEDDRTIFRFAAILRQHPEELEKPEDDGWTPLMNAAYYGQAKVVDFLLSRGAQIYTRNMIGNNAIHIAANANEGKVMEKLLQTGPSVNIHNHSGETPLHVAIGNRMTLTLLEHGADVDIQDLNGKTAIETAKPSKKECIRQWQRQDWEKRVLEFCKGLHPRLGQHSSVRRAWTADLSERNLIWLIGLFLKPQG